MSSRVPPRTRQSIIQFPDKPARGEVTRFCLEHGISRAEFYRIRQRAVVEGPEAAVLPRSTAPGRPSGRTVKQTEDKALEIRAELDRAGLDAGPLSVAAQMLAEGLDTPSRATLARVFARRGVVTPAPDKRPRSSWRRFVYDAPNGCWQLDGMDYRLDNGVKRCILQVEDDHSRKILASLVATSENSQAALDVVKMAVARYGAPAKFLTDNGTAFNLSRRGGESGLEKYLKRLGTVPISGKPSKPTTQGKNERLHHTLQKFLDANRPIWTVKRLRLLVEQFVDYYNNARPHQGLSTKPGQIPDMTPTRAYEAIPKALPAPAPITADTPVRTVTIPHKPSPHRAEPLDATTWQADRLVIYGRITIARTYIQVGTRLDGVTMHIIFDDHTITVIDPDGVILGAVPRPEPGAAAHYSINPHRSGRPIAVDVPPGGTITVQRLVNPDGEIWICRCRIRVGQSLAGKQLTLDVTEHDITVHDPDGNILGVVTRPADTDPAARVNLAKTRHPNT